MHDAAQFHFNAYEISNNFAEAAVMDTCARLQAHSVITCTTKHVFWQISHDFGDKYPMTLTTNIPRERRQISVENDGFWEITRILLQIRCYLCRCSSFPQNLSISNHYFVFLRQVMEKIATLHLVLNRSLNCTKLITTKVCKLICYWKGPYRPTHQNIPNPTPWNTRRIEYV